MDTDSRSINSFSDDLALPERDQLHGGNGVPMNILMTTSIRSNMSRSTDRNLDNMGLSDDDLLIGSSNRTSAEEMLTLLTREPPDGKEKPEPSKSSLLKMETLSRKSSKCDLLSSNSSSNSPQVIQAQNQQPQSSVVTSVQDCRSEATSVCGETSSVLSGYSGAIVATSTTSVTSKATNDLCKRDSLVKDSVYEASNSNQAQQKSSVMSSAVAASDDLDSGVNKEW